MRARRIVAQRPGTGGGFGPSSLRLADDLSRSRRAPVDPRLVPNPKPLRTTPLAQLHKCPRSQHAASGETVQKMVRRAAHFS